MKHILLTVTIACAAAGLMSACSHPHTRRPPAFPTFTRTIEQLRAKYAPDSHLGIYNLGVATLKNALVITGEVDRAEARLETIQALAAAGMKVEDRITVLPAEQLGAEVWGISSLSVATAREQPEHKAEMGTQILMGDGVRVLKRHVSGYYEWYLVQSADGYLAWLEEGTFVRTTRSQLDAWNDARLLIVTALEDSVLAEPRPEAEPVSDVVVGNRVKWIGQTGAWYQVELPDRRVGFLRHESAEEYRAWKQQRRLTTENIERTARRFLGRPYLWGANSPKGLDCSGFTKLVFLLNGLDLDRNAGHQARQGVDVPVDTDLSRLQKGDLLFFGRPARNRDPERITHVGIYLGNKLFIHSSERVRINSLDPASPLRDELRIRTLLRARRLLPAGTAG